MASGHVAGLRVYQILYSQAKESLNIIILKSYRITFILIFLHCTVNSQKNSLTSLNLDSLADNNYKLYQSLRIINIYNYVIKTLDYSDTVTTEISNNNVTFYYRGNQITEFIGANLLEQKPLIIQCQFSHASTFLFAKANISLSEYRKILFYDDPGAVKSGYIKLINYNLDVLSGRYEERKPNGEKKVEGQYCQIDSIYTEIIEVMDPETYELQNEEHKRIKFPLKIGTWKYYDEYGKLLKEENYQFCR